ncbi:MAG: hypothetical protein MJE77_43890 [Proteobacteria bacterium]|nr:hypothetical protein [Pseudomonadota bacterium]
MGWLALAIAVVAAVFAALPSPGMFAAIGTGVLAIAVGMVGYGRNSAPARSRLCSAGAIAIGILALGFSLVRYIATVAAVGELERLF